MAVTPSRIRTFTEKLQVELHVNHPGQADSESATAQISPLVTVHGLEAGPGRLASTVSGPLAWRNLNLGKMTPRLMCRSLSQARGQSAVGAAQAKAPAASQ